MRSSRLPPTRPLPSLSQPGERRPRRVWQPSRSLGQVDDARAVGAPQKFDHQRQLAAVSRGDRMHLSTGVIRTAASLRHHYVYPDKKLTFQYTTSSTGPWIPERSATRLREANLNVFSKLRNQGLVWRLEPKAFTGGEVGREDDLLDVLVGCPIDIQVARQPSP